MRSTQTVSVAAAEPEHPPRFDADPDALVAFLVSRLDARQAVAFRRKMAELDADRPHRH